MLVKPSHDAGPRETNQSTNDEKTVAGLAMARCGEAMDGKEVQRNYAAAAPCIA